MGIWWDIEPGRVIFVSPKWGCCHRQFFNGNQWIQNSFSTIPLTNSIFWGVPKKMPKFLSRMLLQWWFSTSTVNSRFQTFLFRGCFCWSPLENGHGAQWNRRKKRGDMPSSFGNTLSFHVISSYGGFRSHRGTPKSSILIGFQIFHEINHPASLGYAHGSGNLYICSHMATQRATQRHNWLRMYMCMQYIYIQYKYMQYILHLQLSFDNFPASILQHFLQASQRFVSKVPVPTATDCYAHRPLWVQCSWNNLVSRMPAGSAIN